MKLHSNWSKASAIASCWEKETGQVLNLDNLVQYNKEGLLDLYFYEKKRVFCDYDAQHGIYQDYLKECEEAKEAPVSYSEFFADSPAFDTLMNSTSEVNKHGNGIERPVYHVIDNIEFYEEDNSYLCITVIEAGHFFEENFEMEGHPYWVKLFYGSERGKRKGYPLTLDNIFLHSKDIDNFLKKPEKLPSYLDKEHPHSSEESTKTPKNEQRKKGFIKWFEDGGKESISEDVTKAEVWKKLEVFDYKLFNANRDGFFKYVSHLGLIKFKVGNRPGIKKPH